MSKIWSLDRKKVVRKVSREEVPEFVLETLDYGMVAVADGMLYANSFEDLLGDEIPASEVTIEP